MSSPLSSTSGYTPSDIQSHLYISFLHGHTSDVSLRVKAASWEAVYRLHRVVLIQAGFFRSLFTAGFLESQELRATDVNNNNNDDVYVRLDDTNITRAAFEICIARLYGGGPKLYVPPALLATPAHPLTPAFHDNTISYICPADHHPATPRFLLSLLATSTYLSIPSLTSRALSLISSSIGPYTIISYLNFATGKGIGPPDIADLDSAVGLEFVAKPVISSSPDPHLPIAPPIPTTVVAPGSLPTTNSESIYLSDETIQKIGNIDLLPDDISVPMVFDELRSPNGRTTESFPFNYGGIGDKLGESCACWLMRWSADMLALEETHVDHASSTSSTAKQAKRVFPSIWSEDGLSSLWACAVIASDDFFIKGEWERYEFATRVIKLRYHQRSDFSAEEKDWTNLFANGIRYCHLTFDELARISQDVFPLTKKPYVPIEVIQSAHWMQSMLRHRILTRPSGGLGKNVSSSPPPQGKDLGITVTKSEIIDNNPPSSVLTGFNQPLTLYPIPHDSSQRIGDVDNAFSYGKASIDQLFGNSSSSLSQTVTPHHPRPSQSNFFGILPLSYTTLSVSDSEEKTKWSLFPPLRFGVEFWGIEDLSEKSRIHSHTIWYAGSLFNVYVQVVKKKGIQLGIYLHRQSIIDPLPRPSTPPPVVFKRERAITLVGGGENTRVEQPVSRAVIPLQELNSMPSLASIASARAVPGSPRLTPQQNTPDSPPYVHLHLASSSPNRSGMSTPTTPVPTQPYRDPRMIISAHFSISCTSITGSSLTRFTSSPDQFSVSQSWGWKSSSLFSDDTDMADASKKPSRTPKESSLRATVVIGLV